MIGTGGNSALPGKIGFGEHFLFAQFPNKIEHI
jgi:hypothetical protein